MIKKLAVLILLIFSISSPASVARRIYNSQNNALESILSAVEDFHRNKMCDRVQEFLQKAEKLNLENEDIYSRGTGWNRIAKYPE